MISKVIGDKEEAEPMENISCGANSIRDGVSLSHHVRQKSIVMPTELSQLKYPGDHPSTKLQMAYQGASDLKADAFLLKEEKKREYNTEPQETPPEEEKAHKEID
jgi:hypothetical protein